jgi:hypothetical protein
MDIYLENAENKHVELANNGLVSLSVRKMQDSSST